MVKGFKSLEINLLTNKTMPQIVPKAVGTARIRCQLQPPPIQLLKNGKKESTKKSRQQKAPMWNSIPVAAKYRIERKDTPNGAWKYVTTVSNTSYRQIRLTPGKVYYYRVRAIAKTGYAGKLYYSGTPVCTTTPNYKLKQSAKTKTSITLSWSKVPDAAAYYVQYRTNAKAAWKNLKLVNAKTFKVTHTRLKANKTVYYRVLATYKVGKAVRYFEVSPAIKAKTARW